MKKSLVGYTNEGEVSHHGRFQAIRVPLLNSEVRSDLQPLAPRMWSWQAPAHQCWECISSSTK